MRKKKCIVQCVGQSDILFTVPINEPQFLLWKKACEGRAVLKRGYYICANHFNRDDILTKRLLTSEEGKVVGVSNFQRPRLRSGTLPTIFHKAEPETPILMENVLSPPNMLSNVEDNTRTQLPFNANLRTYARPKLIIKTEDEKPCLSPETIHEVDTQITNIAENIPDDLKKSILALPPQHSEMSGKNADINMPHGWNKCESISEPSYMMYFQLLSKMSPDIIANDIFPVIGKTVVVDHNSHVQCSYLGNLIPIDLVYCGDYNGEAEVTVKQLEDIIIQFDQKYTCDGLNIKEEVNKERSLKLKTKDICIDCLNKWRHKNCNIIVKEEEKICITCRSIQQTSRIQLKPLKKEYI